MIDSFKSSTKDLISIISHLKNERESLIKDWNKTQNTKQLFDIISHHKRIRTIAIELRLSIDELL